MRNYDELNPPTIKHVESDEQETHVVHRGYDGVNTYCLIGMLCSILGALLIFVFPVGIILSLVGLIVSSVGISYGNRANKNLSGKGMGKVGIAIPLIMIFLFFAFLSIGNVGDALDNTVDDLSNDAMFSDDVFYDDMFSDVYYDDATTDPLDDTMNDLMNDPMFGN